MKIQTAIPFKASPEVAAADRDKQLREAAKMYENHFLNEMVKAMRATVPKDQGLLKQNMAEKIFAQQLDQKYVEGWTERGGIGLADIIYKQIHEKMFGSKINGLKQPGGYLPLTPKSHEKNVVAPGSVKMKEIQKDNSAQLEYRFEVENPESSRVPYDAQAPLAGTVTDTAQLEDGWVSVNLDHGLGVNSQLTFPGSLSEIVIGQDVEAGRRLGSLDLNRPVMAWKLDRT